MSRSPNYTQLKTDGTAVALSAEPVTLGPLNRLAMHFDGFGSDRLHQALSVRAGLRPPEPI